MMSPVLTLCGGLGMTRIRIFLIGCIMYLGPGVLWVCVCVYHAMHVCVCIYVCVCVYHAMCVCVCIYVCVCVYHAMCICVCI